MLSPLLLDQLLKLVPHHDLIDFRELKFPFIIIEELSQVKSVVVGAISFSMIGRSQYCHFVAVDRVEIEKAFNLIGNLFGWEVGPVKEEPLEHAQRTAPAYLAKFAELVELVIAHTHFYLVKLLSLSVSLDIGSKLCRGFGTGNLGEHWQLEFVAKVDKGPLEVGLIDTSDGVNISGAAIILGHVTSQTFTNIGSPQHQEEAFLVLGPWGELCH